MHKYALVALVRVILPAGLLLSIALRPFGLSLVYLFLFLLAPLANVPDSRSFRGGKFILLILVLSWLLLSLHLVWHGVLFGFAPYGSLLSEHKIIETIGLNLGLVSYQDIDSYMAVHYLAPELVMCGVSLSVYLITKKVSAIVPDEDHKKDRKHQQYPALVIAGKYISLFLIMFSGIMRPSVTSAIYFLVFMGVATAWAVGRPLGKAFAVISRCLMGIMAAHIAGLLVYQCTWLIQLYPPDRDMARYFGLTKLVMINETSPNSFVYEVIEDKKWATLANPLVILFTYYVLALESRELFKPKPKKRSALTGAEAGQLNGSLLRGLSFHHGSRIAVKDKWKTATKKVRVAYSYINSQALRGNPSENIPLMRGMSPSKRWSSVRSAAGNRPLHQDSKGSVVVLDDEDSFTEEVAPTLVDEIVAAIFELFQVLIRSSYIATTITMMAWSIMFHSWLAFVFLMWANIVWLCHDQRSFMLKTSPILVCYAMILLLTQYMYGMDLTEAELPSNITEVNLAQLGLLRPVGEPCVPLLIKSLFTCMFWVTLRQRVQEIRQRRRSAVITDMAAPLQLTVSTAASGVEAQREEEDRSRLLKKFGDFLRFLCARYWIYVVVIMLFVIGITGKRMTIFRIIYMFLFLTFILVFQTSWYWWRRLMYVFWITLIIYSMVNLILIYIYQFDNFSKTIEQYLLINQKLQHDLGLEPYHPADLFVKLLTPTLFLIITIMQVHYFHKDFMELSDPKTSFSRSNSVPRGPDSSRPSQAGASTMRDDLPPLSMEGEQPSSPSQREGSTPRDQNFTVMHYERTSESMKRGLSQSYAPTISERRKSRLVTLYLKHLVKLRIRLQNWMENMFMYLDIHLVKVIFVALMLLCVVNVCAMHVPIMIMIAPALWLSSSKQRFCVLFISALISLYFMAKMVYQIEYIQHSMFDVNCTTSGFNDTVNTTVYNNAEWLGFIKSSKQKPLVVILKGYIGLIALFTFYSLVTYRQQALRSLGVLPPDKYKTMFADITRKDADKDVVHCLKFFVNYGFYKFGIEVCLICLMGVIGSRMDVCAVLYAGWLLTLVSMTRTQLAKIWPVFTTFVTILVPLQYMIAVGFLPQLCIDYPWDRRNEQWSHIRRWLFLPFADDPPYAMKLIFDYLLLLFATRQIRVFYVEKTRGDNYPGGSNNEDTGLDWETPTFVNPVPDFLGYVGTWLDVVKRLVFLGMLWVTLAIMFMTGTNRVNLFSMGYLVGSFIFLWQGTDFYLRPKETILRWWSWLIRYNVSVVVIKALLQIPGCMFSSLMQEHACWMVQLLGIGCVDKFEGNTFKTFLKMKQVKGDVCPVPQEDIGLAWDGVCFAFLILQRRLFHSYYFYRVIDESKATTVLASRGAELIEQLRQKQMHMQEEAESKILDKIKIKMERIKANQKKIRGTLEKDPKHHDAEEDEDTQPGESEGVPLVRGDSDVSGRGYHTPDSPASPRGFHTPISEPSAPPSPERTHPPPPQPLPLPAIPPPSSQGGPPSPSSALMTVSLDAYLEPRRISFESPPNSEFLPRAQSPEESYPVFSPPPIRRRHTVASPSILQRTSIISQSSRAEPNSHHTSVRSGDYYMFDEFDDMDSHDLLMKEESEEDKDAPDKKMGLGELLSAVLKTDLKRAVSMRRASMPAVRTTRHSIGSFPASYPHEAEIMVQDLSEGRRSPPGEERRINTDISMSGREPDDAASDLDEYADMPEHETALDKLKRLLDTLWAFIASMIVSVTRYVMRYSRDYRYVSRTLSIEKKILKEREGFGIGLREGSNMIWEPLPEMLAHNRKLSDISVPEIRILAPSMERGLDASPPPARSALADRDSSADSYRRDDDDTSEHESAFSLQTTSSKDVTTLEEQDDSIFKKNQSPFVQLGYAVWFAILAHTDIVCYITVFINQIQSATILSIPLPLMVFLWGTLTIPRPTKTFWVTLIAYTEVIVLIKSMFQFEILPWNQKATPDNTPFTAPRIIGIERKVNYALYDLLLLLIIFLHRFMLKSLGLWKESTPEIELREDVEYYLTKEDTDLVVQGRGDEVGQKYVELHDRQGPRHRLVDRLYHVQATIAEAVRELGTSRSDPRIATVVWEKLRNQQPTQRGTAGRGHATLRDIVSREIIRRRTVAGDLGITLDKQKTVVVRETDDLEDDDVGKDNEPGPSKPSGDDEHFLVNNEREPIIAVTTILEDKYKHFPNVMLLSFKRYLRPTQVFFKRMLAQGARVTADVYAYMFLCDFFNFLVVIFGFAAFGTHQGDGGVQAYLEENKVPIPFLVMLILQFGLIIIDRALYLRKFILGKILFQYGLIVGVHIWMFFVLPFITERTFNMRWPPPIWYMIKCIYLLLSAYQIRCGYPRRIIGNFLCKSYRFVNMLLFRGFMAVPFVFELRTLMDWIWTDTSMTLMDWLKMEDIFASVFLLKCSRYVEDEFPQPRGVKKSPTAKYLLGGAVLAFVIAIIWFPLVFFAFGNSVGKSNPPTDVTVKIRIGPFLPVYQMSAQKLNIDILTEQDYTQLSNNYVRDRTAQTFLSNYVYDDVAVISLNTYSTAKWMISPPELKRLEDEVVSNASLSVKFTYIITHPTNAVPNPPTLDDNREVSLVPFLPDGKRNPERDKLLMLLNGTAAPDTWLHVHTLFPKFLKVFNKGSTKPADQLMPDATTYESRMYRDVQLRLDRDDTGAMFWRVREFCTPGEALMAIPLNNCNKLVLYTFNDKLFPETLNFISGSGIIGLYTTFVFLASRVLRGFFSGIYTKIMFDDLPNVDRVLQLCLDIYLVREALELSLEEDLFAKLVFLYRSPETMIKWSRPKEEELEPQRALPPSL